MKNISLSIVFLFLISIISKPVNAQEVSEVQLPANLQIVLDSYEIHWKNSDAKALAMLFTEDGFILRPQNSPTRGRENIEKAYQNAGGDLILKAYDFSLDGKLAYIIGGYTYGNRTEDVGKFTLVLKKVNDKWLIHSDMDNGNN